MRKSLQPQHRFNLIFIVTLLALPQLAPAFTYTAVSVSVDNSQVGDTAIYTFTLLRMYDDLLNTTPWASTPLASDATATIIFPSQYTASDVSGATCIDVSISGAPITGVTCTASNLTVTINNAFASTSLVSDMTIIIGNIINPGSAVTTSPFLTTIGSDSSSSTTAAELTLTPGLLTSLSITFKGQYVNTTSDMIITFVAGHAVPQTGAVKVVFPSALIWARELSASHTIPINGTLSCYGLTSNVANGTIGCSGLFATQTITISNVFSTVINAGDNVSLAIKGLFAPPTTEPVDQLTVTTCDASLNSIDSQVGSISNLLPNTLNSFIMASSLATSMYVNSLGGLTFSFTLPDTLSSIDLIVISFPAGTSITYLTTASTIPIQSTTYHSSNTTLVMIQRNTNPEYPAGTSSTITFIRYKASPSTRTTDPITMTMYTNGYSKMTASATISAIAKNYSLAVSPITSDIVNTYTTYEMTFSMIDALSSSGYIDVLLDPLLCVTAAQITTIQSNLTLTVSGSSIRSNPSTQIISTTVNNSSSYLLRITNLNNTSSIIPVQTITISIANLLNCPAVCTLTYFSLATYYTSSDVDLVASANFTGNIVLSPGAMTLMSASFDVTTTYTFGTLSVGFSNQNPVEANGFLVVVLPSQLQLLDVCVGSLLLSGSPLASTVTYNLTTNQITFQLSSALAAASSITFQLINLLSPNSTQTTSTFAVSTFDSLNAAIDITSNSLGVSVSQGNNFNLLTLTRSSTVNSAYANYSLTFEQTQDSNNVSEVTVELNSLLTITSLSVIYQVYSNGSQSAILFSRNGSTIQITLNSQSTSNYTLILNTIGNPPSLQPLTSPFTLTSYTSGRFFIFSSQIGQDIVNTQVSSSLVTSFSFSNLAYGESSSLTVDLTQPADHLTTVYRIVIDVPVDFGVSNASCSGLTGMQCVLTGSTITATMINSSYFPSSIIFNIDNLLTPANATVAQFFTFTTYDSFSYLVQSDNSTVMFQNNCTFPCRTCTSNASVCLSCYTSATTNYTLLYIDSCYQVCPSGAYQVNSTDCATCDSICLSCETEATNCSSCNGSSSNTLLYLNSSTTLGTCLSTCIPGTYSNSTECLECNSTCLQCNSSTICTSCISSYYMYENTCINVCPNNTLTDSINFTCTICDSVCLTCQNSTATCTSCPPFTFLANNTCASQCPSTDMFVDVNQTCQYCNSECLTCQYEAANCTSCNVSSNFSHFINNTCLATCLQLYYSISSTLICQLCSSLSINCSNCSSQTTCLSCDSNYYFLPSNSSCLSSVPDGYVDINGTLQLCNSTCTTCVNQTTLCTSCSGNLSLYNNSCVSSCPVNETVSVSNVCQACLYPCFTCQNSTSTCLSCALNSSLYLDGSSCVSANNCPNGTYANSSTLICQSCDLACLLCDGTSTNCSSCAANYYLDTVNSTCVSNCSSGYVGIGSICENCTTPCATCEVSQINCTSCQVTIPELFLDTSTGSCVNSSICPAYTYANITNLVCQSCPSPCLDCTDSITCISCINGTYLNNGSCLNASACPDGTVPGTNSSTNLSECLNCDSTCLTCINTTSTCTSCNSTIGLFLLGTICVNQTSCPNGTYANISTTLCQNCSSPCQDCSNSTLCTSCIDGYSLMAGGSCVDLCPDGTYNVSSGGIYQCLTCSNQCLTCKGTDINCTSCNNTFLDGNSCVNLTSCSNGTYANTSTNVCQPCVTPCVTCDNSTFCLSCATDLYLDANTGSCLNASSCPNGTIPVNNTGVLECTSCDVSCLTCVGQITNCTSCSSSYLFNNSCVNASTCPDGTFADNSTNICLYCPIECSICTDLTNCSACAPNNVFFNNFCYNSCPNNSIEINGSCQACTSPCNTCSISLTNCTSCLQDTGTPLYLDGSVCVIETSCNNGTTAVNATMRCQTCQLGCNACSNSVNNCTNCSSGYYLDTTTSTCVASCPDGYYPDNVTLTCLNCTNQCLTCSDASTCLSCSPPLVLTNNTCQAACPSTAPYNVSDICLSCQQAISGCILCDSAFTSPVCLKCGSTLVLFNQTCLAACPSGYKADGNGGCQKDNGLDDPLTGSLTIGGVFPMPFTITGSIIFIACFMSKLQNRNTYIIGVAYSLWGIIEVLCLAFTIIKYSNQASYKDLLFLGLFIIGGLNLLALVVQSCQLSRDQKFGKWLSAPFNCGFYGLVVIISTVSSYKFKLIIFTKLFSFKCVRAQLEHVQKFRFFNLLSFLGVAHQGLILYASTLIIITLAPNTSQFLLFLDLTVINILNVILELAASSKNDNFFEEEEEDGIKMNKVYNIYDEEYLKKVDDTLSLKDKKPEFESRDNLLDQDDEFTLSISDRNDDDFPPVNSESLAAPPSNKNNKSTYWEQPFQSQTIFRRENQTDSGNLSAVYAAESGNTRGKKMKNQPQVVVAPFENNMQNSKQELSEKPSQKDVSEVSKRNIFQPEPDNIELPEQNVVVPFGDTPRREDSHALKQQNAAKIEPEEPDIKQIEVKPVQNIKKQLKVSQRQEKIYRGNLPDNFDGDIDEIDLALGKRQRELMQIKKSIHKRENFNQKRSQRQRSRSRGKITKAAMSQKGAMTEYNFKDKLNVKVEAPAKIVDKVPLVVQNNHPDDDISQQLEAPPESVRPEHKNVTDQQHIPQQQMEHHPVTPAVTAVRNSPIKDQSRSPGKLYQPIQAFKIEEMNQDCRDGEDIEQYKIEADKLKVEEDIEQNLPKHKNIFEDRRDYSFLSEDKGPDENKYIGLKAPKSRHNKNIIKQQDNIFTQPAFNLKFESKPDGQNQPLRSKSKNKPRGWEGQAVGQDALEDLIEKTQRSGVAPHRSHLLRGQPEKPAESQYNQLEQISTVREPSVGDLVSKKIVQRPPLQSRPSTSKNRIYMAGMHQLQSHRANSRQKEHKQDLHNKTAYERSFYEPKSREIALNQDSIDMYPSDFTTNRLPGQGEFQPNDEPRKPTIHSRVSHRGIKQTLHHEDQVSLEGSFTKKSMKSYRSRSIQRDEGRQRGTTGSRERPKNDDLKEYYGRKQKSKSRSRSRSRSRDGNRSSDKKMNELEKIYLQKLDYKK